MKKVIMSLLVIVGLLMSGCAYSDTTQHNIYEPVMEITGKYRLIGYLYDLGDGIKICTSNGKIIYTYSKDLRDLIENNKDTMINKYYIVECNRMGGVGSIAVGVEEIKDLEEEGVESKFIVKDIETDKKNKIEIEIDNEEVRAALGMRPDKHYRIVYRETVQGEKEIVDYKYTPDIVEEKETKALVIRRGSLLVNTGKEESETVYFLVLEIEEDGKRKRLMVDCNETDYNLLNEGDSVFARFTEELKSWELLENQTEV